MATILLTGGLGFIGSHICVELLKEDKFTVVVVDNLSNSSRYVIDRIFQITGRNPVFYELDVCDSKLEDIFLNHKIDSVIHLAGLKAVNESIHLPIKYYDVNLCATINLIKCMEQAHCYNLIFSSSATVYGSSPSPLTEQSQTGIGISNPYGRSKHIIEQMLSDLCYSNPKWNVITLRYFNPIGADESGLIGEHPNNIPNNLMPYLLRVVHSQYSVLNIFGSDYDTEDGTCQRDFIHVTDLALAHIASLNYKPVNQNYNYFNIGTGQPVSVLQLIHTFIKINKCKLPYKFVDRRPGDLHIVYCDNSKAIKELNWAPTRSLEDMCKDSYNFKSF